MALGIGNRERAKHYAAFSLYSALFVALLYGVLTTGWLEQTQWKKRGMI